MEALLREIEQFNSQEDKLHIEVEYCDTHETVLCLHLYGELDNETSPPFEKIVDTLFSKEYVPPTFILECSSLSYVSSTGIGSFVRTLMQCNRRDKKLYLCALADKTQNLFSLLGFSRYFTFIESPTEVMKQSN
ncbi:MAG: STAS domain-containing protein [bacterium]